MNEEHTRSDDAMEIAKLKKKLAKKNPQDLTLRNLRALKKRVERLEKRVAKLEKK